MDITEAGAAGLAADFAGDAFLGAAFFGAAFARATTFFFGAAFFFAAGLAAFFTVFLAALLVGLALLLALTAARFGFFVLDFLDALPFFLAMCITSVNC